MNYSTTEKELFTIVFALDKFCAYIVGSPIVIFTDHAALKYLLTKNDAKPQLIRWILLLQEFNITIKDKKGVDTTPIKDYFPNEQLFVVSTLPWYVDIVNFLIIGKTPTHWSA